MSTRATEPLPPLPLPDPPSPMPYPTGPSLIGRGHPDGDGVVPGNPYPPPRHRGAL